jgi:hypothetical protein
VFQWVTSLPRWQGWREAAPSAQPALAAWLHLLEFDLFEAGAPQARPGQRPLFVQPREQLWTGLRSLLRLVEVRAA